MSTTNQKSQSAPLAKGWQWFVKHTTPTTVFLSLAIGFGGLFVFLIPPFQSPDEQAHFFRSYHLADGHIYPEAFEQDGQQRYGGRLPISVVHDTFALKGDISGNPAATFGLEAYGTYVDSPLNPGETDYVFFEGATIYSPVSYGPQVVGLFIGKLWQASPLVLMWLGRLANLAVWILCIYIALRLLPVAKWGMVALALNPLTLFLAATLSGDVLPIGLVFIFISLLLNLIKRSSLLTHRDILAVGGCLLAIGLTKPTNLILGGLIFLLPRRLFTSWRRYLLVCGGCLLAAGLAALAWNASVRYLLDTISAVQRPDITVSASQQVGYLLTQPLEYIRTLITNYVTVQVGSGDAVLRSTVGSFGWLDTHLPLWAIVLQYLVFLLALLYQVGRGVVVALWGKALVVATLVAGSVLAVTALYLNYNQVGATIIEGVQGRYFIPLSALAIPLFTGRQKVLMIKEREFSLLLSGAIVILLALTSLMLYIRYY